MIEKDPTITTREQYLTAVRAYMRMPRYIGHAILLTGLLAFVPAVRDLWGGSVTPGWVLIGLGWGVYFYVIFQRSRWAKINRIEG